MEKEKEKKKNDISFNQLPPELIQNIFMRLSAKHLARLKCICKPWLSLISNQNFAQSHFQLSSKTNQKCLFIQTTQARIADLEAMFCVDAPVVAATLKKVTLPLKTKPPSEFHVLGSCRGFVCLHKEPHLFIVWNPLTGSHRRISYYHHIVRNAYGTNRKNRFNLLDKAFLVAFAYDASKDDYLVVTAWMDKNKESRFDFFSLRTNSWESFDVVLPNKLKRCIDDPGLFFDGAIHWLPRDRADAILAFDLREKSFLEIPLPENEEIPCFKTHLMVLGGCLALYFRIFGRTKIWVMQEYKVQSSWAFCEVSTNFFLPLCLSNSGDLVGFVEHYRFKDNTDSFRYRDRNGFSKYNLEGELLSFYPHSYGVFQYTKYTVYTESLLLLPNDSEDKKKKND